MNKERPTFPLKLKNNFEFGKWDPPKSYGLLVRLHSDNSSNELNREKSISVIFNILFRDNENEINDTFYIIFEENDIEIFYG